MSEAIKPMQKLHSINGSEFKLSNLRVPEKEIIEDESEVNYASDTECNNESLEKNIADLDIETGSNAISNGVVTRHLCYLLLSIVFAILILVLSGALIFYSFQHQTDYAKNLNYYNIDKDRGAYLERCKKAKVIGGEDVKPAEFPYQVYFAGSKVRCGGSILNEDFILTAAHCFFTSDGTWRNSSIRWRIVGGDTNLNETEGTEQIRNISIIYTHPGFRSGSPLDDIALVKLRRPFKLNQFVQSVLLPTRNFLLTFGGESALYVSGYGDLSYKGARPTILQKASLSINTTSECQAAYAVEGIEITEKMICAGAGVRDSCQGDSGGPLSFRRCDFYFYEHKSVLVGVVSGGIECGREKYPGVYTKVSKYVDWIQTSIENASIWSNIV